MLRRILTAVTTAVLGGLVLSAPVATPVVPISHAPIVALDASQSANWSGYNQGSIEQGGKLFSEVRGTWVVPAASQHTAGEQEYSSTWIGIGGGCVDAGCTITDGTLIQEGTEQDVAPDGTPSYDAWWELIPAPEVVISGFDIHPGDLITADIKEVKPDLWWFFMLDRTTGQRFSKFTPYTSTHATAEWITETPLIIGTGGGLAAMPNLTTVHMQLAKTNFAPANLSDSEAIQLVQSSQVVATPSNVDPDADGFNDCTWATSCPRPAHG
jgi:Peptidase A4 family